MNTPPRSAAGEARLFLAERFDHSMLADFRAAFLAQLEPPDVQRIVIDCSKLSYIDSLGLGLLLVLREKAAERNVPITLHGVIERIRKTLWIANFQNLFDIS